MAHILLIDDEPDHLMLFSLLLRKEGYTVSTASDGVMGLALALCQQHDLIILDLVMPQINGWQVLQILKGHPATLHTPVVISTARHLTVEELLMQKQAGTPILQKPWAVDELLLQIRMILDQTDQYQPSPRQATDLV